MPEYRHGDMWSVLDEVDCFIITTNSTIKKDGAVVMGRGIAKQLRDREPGIDVKIGQAINMEKNSTNQYGFIDGGRYGVFQVKYFWGDPADIELIKLSTVELAIEATANPGKKYALNFPGIGNGGLPLATIKPVVDILPNNVQVWTFQPLN